LVVGVAPVLAAPAAAFDLDAAAVRRLEQDRPYVFVAADAGGAAGLIRGAIDIAAPPEAVWAVILDCDRAPRMVARLKSCRVLERDPAGRWDVREHISKPALFPSVRSVFRSEYEPHSLIRFQRAGGDLKALTGEWRLTPLDDGARTRVTYENRASTPFRAPGAIIRMTARADVEAALVALRRESQASR
jgi:uncharacterized membrane protein